MKRESFRVRGFTLIELLVVVAIIALLISILLPSLSQARESAKVGVCLANLRSMMQATTLYLHEWQDNFPFVVTTGGGSLGICSWSYGGQTSDEYWKTQTGGVFFVQVQNRPLNKYLLGATPDIDVMDTSGKILKRTQVPIVRCPSDKTSYQRFWNTNALGMSCYDDVGTSYQYNLHYVLSPNGIDVQRTSDTSQGQTTNWLWYQGGFQMLSQDLIRDAQMKMGNYPLYIEDPTDFALGNRLVRIGNHGKVNKHTMGFIDGHASYVLADTRVYCGPGWHALDTEWVWYQHPPQGKPARYYYPNFNIRNCDPPPK